MVNSQEIYKTTKSCGVGEFPYFNQIPKKYFSAAMLIRDMK